MGKGRIPYLIAFLCVLLLTACQSSKTLGVGPGVMYYTNPEVYVIHYPPRMGMNGDVWNFVLTRGDDVTQLRLEFFGDAGPVEVNYRP